MIEISQIADNDIREDRTYMLSLSLFERNLGKSCQREYIVATPMRLSLVGYHSFLFVFVSKQKH